MAVSLRAWLSRMALSGSTGAPAEEFLERKLPHPSRSVRGESTRSEDKNADRLSSAANARNGSRAAVLRTRQIVRSSFNSGPLAAPRRTAVECQQRTNAVQQESILTRSPRRHATKAM